MNEEYTRNQDYISIMAGVYLFVKRNFVILMVALLLGVGLGIYKNQQYSAVYSKYIIFNSKFLTSEVSSDIIKSLQYYINFKNHSTLAKELGVTTEAALSVTRFNTGTYMSKKNNRFWVEIGFDSDKYVDTITTGLLNLFNNNEFIKKEKEAYVNKKRSLLTIVNNAIASLDSNSYKVTGAAGNKANMLNLPGNSELCLVKLFEMKADIEQDVQLDKSVSVIDEFYYPKTDNKTLGKSILMYGFGIGIIGLIIALLTDTIRKVKAFLKVKKI